MLADDVEEWHCLDHHAAVSGLEDTPTEGEGELRDNAGHEEHGHAERPIVRVVFRDREAEISSDVGVDSQNHAV